MRCVDLLFDISAIGRISINIFIYGGFTIIPFLVGFEENGKDLKTSGVAVIVMVLSVFVGATDQTAFYICAIVVIASSIICGWIDFEHSLKKGLVIYPISLVIIFIIVGCIEWYVTPSGTIEILVDKREKAEKLSLSLSASIKELNGKILSVSDDLEAVYESEKAELEILKEKANKFAHQCKILEARYECAKRIVQRNKELGAIINVEATKNLEQIEEEIKNFLKESKAMKLDEEGE